MLRLLGGLEGGFEMRWGVFGSGVIGRDWGMVVGV